MRLRPAALDDAEAVLELIVARDVADFGVPDYTLADLRQEWALAEVDLSRDAVVVEDEDGSLVGYAIVRSVGAQVIVPPEQTGRGIGSRLLTWAPGGRSAVPGVSGWLSAMSPATGCSSGPGTTSSAITGGWSATWPRRSSRP